MESLADEVEEVRAVVGRFFPIYDIRVRPEAIAFYVRTEERSLDEKFEALRMETRGGKYIPVLRLEGGEHVLYVQRTPPRRFRGRWLNVVLLIATIATTLIAGMVLWSGYVRSPNFFSLSNVFFGALTFTLPLLTILGTHEMGHFVLAKRHNVNASLPFFIPAPPIPFGTFGALISMREPIPNKKALLDIGIAGPVLGLAVALPITLLGLYLNATYPQFTGPNTGGGGVVGLPLFYEALLFAIPLPDQALLHPTAFAGWVGFLVTALNLLPAGQLDGGHVARALLGENSRYLSYGAFVILLALGFLFFFSWILLAFVVLFLGLRHPPPLNDITPLDGTRKLAGVAVLVILALSFHPVPLDQIQEVAALEFRDTNNPVASLPFVSENPPIQADNVTLVAGEAAYPFLVNNTPPGNVLLQVRLSFGTSLAGWEILFASVGGQEIRGDNATVFLNAGESVFGSILIRAPTFLTPGTVQELDIVADIIGESPTRPESQVILRLSIIV